MKTDESVEIYMKIDGDFDSFCKYIATFDWLTSEEENGLLLTFEECFAYEFNSVEGKVKFLAAIVMSVQFSGLDMEEAVTMLNFLVNPFLMPYAFELLLENEAEAGRILKEVVPNWLEVNELINYTNPYPKSGEHLCFQYNNLASDKKLLCGVEVPFLFYLS